MPRLSSRIFGLIVPGLIAALHWSCGEEQESLGHSTNLDTPSVEKSLEARRIGPPNLILITLDTTRADALGSYGQALPVTPHIDKLASEGVVFEQAMTTNPETLPSHASIFTGKWPHQHGIRANAGFILPNEQLTLAEALKQRGYRTAAEIAAPVLRKETQITQGFDHYRGAESLNVELKTLPDREEGAQRLRRPAEDITNRGISFLRQYRDEPFFLWLHYFDAHDPYFAPRDFRRQFPEDPYLAEVAYTDSQIGRLLDTLKELGLDEDTLIMLTADHGEGLGEHGEPSHSYFVYDTTMRVPLVLWGPGRIPAGNRVSSPVRTIDIFPTALEVLGFGKDTVAEGQSLTPLLAGSEPRDTRLAYGEASRFRATFALPMLRFLRKGDWKYIHKVNPELYNVKEDPGESKNLADHNPEKLAELKQDLKQMLSDMESSTQSAHAEVDAQRAAELIALGYVAHGPRFEISDAQSELELFGRDPNTLAEDTESLSIAQGSLHLGEAEEALVRLEAIRDRTGDNVHLLNLIGRALTELERTNEALESYADLLAIAPCEYEARSAMTTLLRNDAQWKAILQLLKAGHQACPNDKGNRNDFAWALATLPSEQLRDGQRALSIIGELLDPQTDANPAYLDTLSAALAETGNFREAEERTLEALQLLETRNASADILAVVRGHLESYRRLEPIRDPPGT